MPITANYPVSSGQSEKKKPSYFHTLEEHAIERERENEYEWRMHFRPHVFYFHFLVHSIVLKK